MQANDRDHGAVLTYSADGGTVTATPGTTVAASYGSFTIDSTTGAYTFHPDDTAVDKLNAGDVVTVTYAVTATDDHQTTATANYTVTINGANDTPVLATTRPPTR